MSSVTIPPDRKPEYKEPTIRTRDRFSAKIRIRSDWQWALLICSASSLAQHRFSEGRQVACKRTTDGYLGYRSRSLWACASECFSCIRLMDAESVLLMMGVGVTNPASALPRRT
eukprot:scaffold1051_cov254-Pinguiococcus_pyrenoidosus.AAC.3